MAVYGWFSEKAKQAGHMSGVYLNPSGFEVKATWLTVGSHKPYSEGYPATKFDDFTFVGEVREVVSLSEGSCRESCCLPDE